MDGPRLSLGTALGSITMPACWTVLTAVSRSIKAHYERLGFPSDRITVVPKRRPMQSDFPGVIRFPRGDLRARFGIPQSAFVLGYSGGMEAWRRIPDWVNIVVRMMKDQEGHIPADRRRWERPWSCGRDHSILFRRYPAQDILYGMANPMTGFPRS